MVGRVGTRVFLRVRLGVLTVGRLENARTPEPAASTPPKLVNCFRVWDHKRGLRRELRALEDVARSVGSATMTTPMGRAHHLPTLDTGCRPL